MSDSSSGPSLRYCKGINTVLYTVVVESLVSKMPHDNIARKICLRKGCPSGLSYQSLIINTHSFYEDFLCFRKAILDCKCQFKTSFLIRIGKIKHCLNAEISVDFYKCFDF